jgi:hypothetical protein
MFIADGEQQENNNSALREFNDKVNVNTECWLACIVIHRAEYNVNFMRFISEIAWKDIPFCAADSAKTSI